MLKKIALLSLLLGTVLSSTGQSVSGNVYCSGFASASIRINGSVAPGDVGLPGAVWIGIEDPANPGYPTAFLTPSGWVPWSSAGFPTYTETSSLQSSFSYSACVPGTTYNGCASTTGNYSGWKIYAGYGVFTPGHQDLIAKRRATLDAAKPALQKKGKWRAEYEDDIGYRNSLIQKSANEGRWGHAFTVQNIDCKYFGND